MVRGILQAGICDFEVWLSPATSASGALVQSQPRGKLTRVVRHVPPFTWHPRAEGGSDLMNDVKGVGGTIEVAFCGDRQKIV